MTGRPAVAEAEAEETGDEADDRKLYGLPRFLTLADGRRMDTRRGTIPKQSHFACGACGMSQDIRESVEATEQGAPVAVYIAGILPARVTQRDAFTAAGSSPHWLEMTAAADCRCGTRMARPAGHRPAGLLAARRVAAYLYDPPCELRLAETGLHALVEDVQRPAATCSLPIAAMCIKWQGMTASDVRHQALGAIQQYLRNQNMFCI